MTFCPLPNRSPSDNEIPESLGVVVCRVSVGVVLAAIAALLLLIGQELFMHVFSVLLMLLLLFVAFTLPKLGVLVRDCGHDGGVKENTVAPTARALGGADCPSPVGEVSRESRRGRRDNDP